MTVYDLQNVTVDSVGNPAIGYTITANDGYYIHLPTYEDNVFTTAVVLLASYDFSTVQIVAEAEKQRLETDWIKEEERGDT